MPKFLTICDRHSFSCSQVSATAWNASWIFIPMCILIPTWTRSLNLRVKLQAPRFANLSLHKVKPPSQDMSTTHSNQQRIQDPESHMFISHTCGLDVGTLYKSAYPVSTPYESREKKTQTGLAWAICVRRENSKRQQGENTLAIINGGGGTERAWGRWAGPGG